MQRQQAKENQASTSKHPNQDPLAIGHTSHMTNPSVYPTISQCPDDLLGEDANMQI